MIIDGQNIFSQAQAVTASAISTNVIDLGLNNAVAATGRDIGTGANIYLVVILTVAMTDSGSDSTVDVSLESDSTADLATSATVHSRMPNPAASSTVATPTFSAVSAAGSTRIVRVPPLGTMEQFLGVRYTVAGGSLSAGSFWAFLTTGIDAQRIYASNYSAV